MDTENDMISLKILAAVEEISVELRSEKVVGDQICLIVHQIYTSVLFIFLAV